MELLEQQREVREACQLALHDHGTLALARLRVAVDEADK